MDVRVALGERSYDVVVETADPAAAAPHITSLGARRAVIVTDDVVGPLWAVSVRDALVERGVQVGITTFPHGEANKTLATWSALVEQIVASGVDRSTVIVAVGGGVVGDVAGFAAASVLRGLAFVQIPTTVLAMVDSSVGGKTAVNLPIGKNLVGAFHQPSLVFAGLGALTTLPARERVAGLGEVLKTALIADPELLSTLEFDAERLRAGDPDALAPVIARCVAIKAEIVARDERETGDRVWLNVGHTVGHGLEVAAGYGALLHGEAVALGTLAELRWATAQGWCADADLAPRVERLAERLGLPTSLPPIDLFAVEAAMRLDKKATATTIRVPVVIRAGQMTVVPVPVASLRELIRP